MRSHNEYFLDEDGEVMDADAVGFTEDQLETCIKVLIELSNPLKKCLLRNKKFDSFKLAMRSFLGTGQEKKFMLKKYINKPSIDIQ
jgi:hypothetical protein